MKALAKWTMNVQKMSVTARMSAFISKGFPILLDTERWARSWSRCIGSQPAGDRKSSTRRYAAITFCQACGYLPSRRASPPFGRYQVILLGHRGTQVWTTCQMLVCSVASSRIWTHDLLIASPALYPLHYRATLACRNKWREVTCAGAVQSSCQICRQDCW